MSSEVPEYGKMDTKAKEEWIAALRSGQYQQCTGRLRRGDKFCCLGVMCDLKKGVAGLDWAKVDRQGTEYEIGNRYNCSIPAPLRIAINLGMAEEWVLMTLNDSGKTFEDIASWIEANL